jgi:hypothetical protein
MTYVILTASTAYRGNSTIDTAEHITWNTVVHPWVQQIDFSDGALTTNPHAGQRVLNYRVEAPPWPSQGTAYEREQAFRRAVIQETLLGWRTASSWAGRGGTIGVLFDHGAPGFVGLGPHGFMQFTSAILLGIDMALRSRPNNPMLADHEQALLDIGGILRAAHVRRVELLSCDIPTTPAGLGLLDWLHRHWRVPVWAYNGSLMILDWQAWIAPPSGPRFGHPGTTGVPYYRRYDRRLPNDPRLFVVSNPGRAPRPPQRSQRPRTPATNP